MVHRIVLSAFLPPLNVRLVLSCTILVDQRLNHLIRVVKLSEAILEHASLLEVLDVGLPGFQLVKLGSELRKYVSDARVVC